MFITHQTSRSLSSSDEEADELLRRVEKDTPRAGRQSKNSDKKRTGNCAKSRSRSITPPPELAHSALQHARDTVRWVSPVLVYIAIH